MPKKKPKCIKEKYIIPDEIKKQPIEWLIEHPGYVMREHEKVMECLRKKGCKTINDVIPIQFDIPNKYRIEVVRKVKWNM